MKLSSSSSLFLATLASSGSLSALAAPTGDPGDLGLPIPSLGDLSPAKYTQADPGQTNTQRRGIAAQQLEQRGLLAGLPMLGPILDPLLGPLLTGVLATLGLAPKDGSPVTAETVAGLTPAQVSQVEDALGTALGGLPLPVSPPPLPLPGNTHAAFALNAIPASFTESAYPATADYPFESYSYESDYNAEAATPTPPRPPVPANPLSPPLPANPPNTPVPAPQGAPAPPAPAPPVAAPPPSSTTSASTSAATPSATST